MRERCSGTWRRTQSRVGVGCWVKTILETTGVRREVSPRAELTPRGRLRPPTRQMRLLEVRVVLEATEVLVVLEAMEVLEAMHMFPRKYPVRRPGGSRGRRARRMPRAEALLRKRARPASARPERRIVPGSRARREVVRRAPRAHESSSCPSHFVPYHVP